LPLPAAAKQFTRRAEEMLGKIWMDQGEHARAREPFTRLLSEFPTDFAAHYNLGSLAYEDKNWDEATRHLRTALEIEPNNALAHFALGTVDFQTGDLPGARDQLSIGIKLDPKFAQAHYYLGLMLSQSGMRDDAAREFRKALEADPNTFRLYRRWRNFSRGVDTDVTSLPIRGWRRAQPCEHWVGGALLGPMYAGCSLGVGHFLVLASFVGI
jgi:tetratricopeptide (TPR) repeat protein